MYIYISEPYYFWELLVVQKHRILKDWNGLYLSVLCTAEWRTVIRWKYDIVQSHTHLLWYDPYFKRYSNHLHMLVVMTIANVYTLVYSIHYHTTTKNTIIQNIVKRLLLLVSMRIHASLLTIYNICRKNQNDKNCFNIFFPQ